MSSPVDPSQATTIQGDILIVDDIPENLESLSKILTRQGHKVRSVLNGPTALKVAKAAQPDLILLDIKMPEMDGYQVCQRLKSDPFTQEIPIIFLSALDQTQDKVTAFSVGGIDYIPKPFQAKELTARVTNHLNLRLAKAQVQQLNAELEQRVIQRTMQLEREIGDRLKAQEQLLHVATHNRLTDLPNRAFLMQRLGQIFSQTLHQSKSKLVLMMIECEHLRLVNNSLGHSAGDQLIVSIMRRLQTCLGKEVLLAHFGNDTFAILLENCTNFSTALALAKTIQSETRLPFDIEEQPIYITLCISLVQNSATYEHPKYLLRDATTALSQAKIKGSGKIQVFDPAMHHRTLHFFAIQNELNIAIANQNLRLVYQPLQSLATDTIEAMEALVRWHHPQRGVIPPEEFISIAEETGLIVILDRYVLRQACTQLRQWQTRQLIDKTFRLHVNLSAQQLSQADFIDYLDRILSETQADCCNLALEITEEGLMQKDQFVLNVLDHLKQRQIHVSIDDFGTGYSSLSYLQLLNVQNLKIDRTFITPATGTLNPKIVSAIINLAHSLDMTVTAEGVETEAGLVELKALGCDFAQGYFLGRPMDSQQYEFRIKG
ncbi:MAG: EAL domain-containing protein [Cyanobacteria bacterium J06659_2]